jgi:hypothetical protein
MSFTGSERAEQHHVLCLGDELAGGQMGDGGAAGSALMVEVERLDCLAGWNPAARMRISAPDDSRENTSRESAADRYSSCVQLESRAWSVRRAALS